WLHYNDKAKGILCFYFVKSTLSKKADAGFSIKGFINCKNATTRFKHHELFQSHAVVCTKREKFDVLLSSAVAKQQEEAQYFLQNVLGSVMYLARQGLAIRGHDIKDGHLIQLLKFKFKGDECLSCWLSQYHDYTSPKVQNEILQLLGNTIVREISACIQALLVLQYSLIIDGTQDISGQQESICLRFVDHDLVPQEVFVGLYQVPGTTGAENAKSALDVLRLNIPVSSLCGQTYDGAANMSGKYSGILAELKKMQPLALFVHCRAHCLNLITEAACHTSLVVRDALQWIHELGTLSKQSGKFKSSFAATASSAEGPSISLRPLCPTRWTVRGKAVLESLEHMASSNIKANGLLQRFQKGTVLGLRLALSVVDDMECLNGSIQKRTETISGMREAIECVRSSLLKKEMNFDEATQMVDALGLEEIKMPHQRRPPTRYSGNASQHCPKTAEEHHRVQFCHMFDTADMQFQERFTQADLNVLEKLEAILLSGDVDETVDQYPELSSHSLKVQLNMFHAKCACKSSDGVVTLLREMTTDVRGLFDSGNAVTLLLVNPVSSAEAERSFSALRGLKTWLRSTMIQVRLNNAAVCHVHQTKLDDVDIGQICLQFVSMSDRKRQV
uniref:DUF4371 domain-containing protein n=1 Tax=Poecilia formosa TaxID=48698 RepID=A0A087XAH7_POEFO